MNNYFDFAYNVSLEPHDMIIGYLHENKIVKTFVNFILHITNWELLEIRNNIKHENQRFTVNEIANIMSPVKRICVFEHSVMTNFNCACPAIQRGQGSGFLFEGAS